MTDLLTVYDDDQANSFIDCMICDKRIRGETHYKIHVTTVQHLKKEDALVAQGQIPRQPKLPEWKDIKHYLEYLSLDEPIIGLNSLVQLPDHITDDGKNVLKYKCRMCFVEMDLYSMVAHIVGRKHRQKHLEIKRPDLVTWTDNAQKQPGLVARAKAAVVEKQEGWGSPVPLKPAKTYQGPVSAHNLRPSAQQQPYHGQDVHRMTSSAEENWMYSSKEPQAASYYTADRYDSGGPMGHQSYPEENRHQSYPEESRHQSYQEVNRHQRPYEEAGTGGRPSRGDIDRGRPREEYDRGQFARGDRVVSLDAQEKGYHEAMPTNRFNDKDLRVYRPGGSEYQKKPVHGDQYGAYDDRKSAASPMSMQGRSFHDEGKRGTVREMHSRHDEMQAYPHNLDPVEFSLDDIPAKRKKKSRFSDATAEEIALAHIRHSNRPVHEKQPREGPIRAKPLLNQFVDSRSNTPKEDNVLDIFNNIQIENMDDARLLKEKLCTVLKEFQTAKSEREGGHHSQSVSDHRGVNQPDQRRDTPDSMYSQNRGFQEPRRYDDDRRGLQEYGNDPRGFRQGEEDPRAARHYGDYPSDLPEARHYAEDPRAFPNTRGQENPPERRRYEDDLRQKEQQYEEYPPASRVDAPRSSQEARYYDERYRGYGGMDSERNWEQQKGRSKESYGKHPAHFQPHSLQDVSRMYGGRGQQRSHQTGEELYDPFQPSSSPPPEASSSTSLDKIASTLLELVSRR